LRHVYNPVDQGKNLLGMITGQFSFSIQGKAGQRIS